ncbi:hypothetical protein B296_00045909 [Ensete ventricosum]|uniref:Uncharacterized protein n=1 Tax=Ensete ventricosum TaxID=4639 RepID=A0A426WYC5_ENSVE|nr:hypothetical protein B296_00045909 [Ensete ventricosum]
MASPHVGSATHGQAASKAPCKGWLAAARASPQGATACEHDGLWPARRGGSRWQHGTPKGAECRAPIRDCCSRPALTPAGVVAPTVGVAALGRAVASGQG